MTWAFACIAQGRIIQGMGNEAFLYLISPSCSSIIRNKSNDTNTFCNLCTSKYDNGVLYYVRRGLCNPTYCRHRRTAACGSYDPAAYSPGKLIGLNLPDSKRQMTTP